MSRAENALKTAIPARFLRPQVTWRSLASIGANHADSTLSVGFMRKDGVRDDQRDVEPPWWSAALVLRGSGEYVAGDGRRFALAPGVLFQRHPGHRHSTILDPDSGWAEAYVLLGPAHARALIASGLSDPRRPVFTTGIDLAVLERLALLTTRLANAPEAALPRCLGELFALAIELLSAGAPDPYAALIESACAQLANSADRRDVLAEVLAEAGEAAHGLSYERFRKLFRARVGVSPGDYRIRRRIDRARELLRADERPIAAIAAQLGYANPFIFSAQFHRVVGRSPRAFRAGR